MEEEVSIVTIAAQLRRTVAPDPEITIDRPEIRMAMISLPGHPRLVVSGENAPIARVPLEVLQTITMGFVEETAIGVVKIIESTIQFIRDACIRLPSC